MLNPDALTMAMPGFSTQMGKNALTNVNDAKRCVSSWHIPRRWLFPPEPAVVTIPIGKSSSFIAPPH
jgi:hypothetical protein